MSFLPLVWTAVAQNRKTGPIPTAYVGRTREETEASCSGCALREVTCYAWHGPQLPLGLLKIQGRAARDPDRYTLASALERRLRSARVARVSAIGDPARADRVELLRAFATLRAAGLGVVGYTHFHRDEENEHLRSHLMASVDSLEEVDEAVARGWKVATVLPAHLEGATTTTPGGAKVVVCPAQRRDNVTCNSCGMCDPQHQVWSAGKVQAIGFLDHSRSAQRAARLAGRRLPTAGVAGARAAVGWAT